MTGPVRNTSAANGAYPTLHGVVFAILWRGPWVHCPRPQPRASSFRIFLAAYFTDTNGTAEPGTIVVGSTPFQRSACTSVTWFGVVPSALARASMAAASASPVSLMLVDDDGDDSADNSPGHFGLSRLG